jgi:hypothetical protein
LRIQKEDKIPPTDENEEFAHLCNKIMDRRASWEDVQDAVTRGSGKCMFRACKRKSFERLAWEAYLPVIVTAQLPLEEATIINSSSSSCSKVLLKVYVSADPTHE